MCSMRPTRLPPPFPPSRSRVRVGVPAPVRVQWQPGEFAGEECTNLSTYPCPNRLVSADTAGDGGCASSLHRLRSCRDSGGTPTPPSRGTTKPSTAGTTPTSPSCPTFKASSSWFSPSHSGCSSTRWTCGPRSSSHRPSRRFAWGSAASPAVGLTTTTGRWRPWSPTVSPTRSMLSTRPPCRRRGSRPRSAR